jgi:triacylglycerol lipase
MGPIKELSLERQAYLFAKLSGIAYKNALKGGRIFKRLGFQSTFLNKNGNEAYILENEHDLIFVCRGTEVSKWGDLKEDLLALRVKYGTNGAKIHKGFDIAARNLQQEFNERTINSKEKKVWCVGHSLGAAMVTIIAMNLFNEPDLPTPEAIFTYGCPRVGNKKFAALLDNTGIPNHRFVNNGDIVARVPFWPYKHAGTMHYISFSGVVMAFSKKQRLKDVWHGFFKLLRTGKISFFSDHSITHSYLPAIKHWMLDR